MSAPVGNSFWRQCKLPTGAPRIYETPEALWDDCCQYFEWVEENPLYERKAFSFQGAVITEDLPKLRALTIEGLCGFLGISRWTWSRWKQEREDLCDTIELIELIIYEQKFSGAAAELLNPSFIGKALRITDRIEISASGDDIESMTNEELEQRAADIAARLIRSR